MKQKLLWLIGGSILLIIMAINVPSFSVLILKPFEIAQSESGDCYKIIYGSYTITHRHSDGTWHSISCTEKICYPSGIVQETMCSGDPGSCG